MTYNQYLTIYERERKSKSVADASQVIFKALQREIQYRISEKREPLVKAMYYADTIWQVIATKNPELCSSGFKDMARIHAEQLFTNEREERLRIIKLLDLNELKNYAPVADKSARA
jgi:hypothetical protein